MKNDIGSRFTPGPVQARALDLLFTVLTILFGQAIRIGFDLNKSRIRIRVNEVS